MPYEHLVVVGNGMAGMACVDEILKRKPYFRITVFSEEPYYNYNRILLSSVLAGEKKIEDIYINTEEWYKKNNITLHLGTKITDVDAQNKIVETDKGTSFGYDRLLFATGSNPFIPPIDGVRKKGVYVFRNMSDTYSILEHCKSAKNAVVIGGGLLGLEAARGLLNQGLRVAVVHIMDRLMDVQLDAVGGQFLKREIGRASCRERVCQYV